MPVTPRRPMTRWKASATHLCLSVFIVGGIAITAFLLWYPDDLYKVAGLDRILLVMLGIDLTAGPLLTLIVYRAGKPSLKFDLAVIAIAQVAFLSYGLHTLWGGRPVFLVGTPDTFTLVFANEISDADLAQAATPAWRALSWTGPVLVGTQLPTDPERRKQILKEFVAGGAGIERTPAHYQPYRALAPAILAKSRAVPNADSKTAVTADASPGDGVHGRRWMPIVSRRGSGTLIIDGTTGMPVETVDEDFDSIPANGP